MHDAYQEEATFLPDDNDSKRLLNPELRAATLGTLQFSGYFEIKVPSNFTLI